MPCNKHLVPSRPVSETLDLGRLFSHHSVRSVPTTSVQILPYRPPAWLIRSYYRPLEKAMTRETLQHHNALVTLLHEIHLLKTWRGKIIVCGQTTPFDCTKRQKSYLRDTTDRYHKLCSQDKSLKTLGFYKLEYRHIRERGNNDRLQNMQYQNYIPSIPSRNLKEMLSLILNETALKFCGNNFF